MPEEPDALVPLLRAVGVELPASVTSAAQLGSEELVTTSLFLLRTLAPDSVGKLPSKLPRSAAARFRLCADLSTWISNLGYKDELGYQTFLYPNLPETRRLLLFLLDRMPSSSSSTSSPATASSLSRWEQLRASVGDAAAQQWSPLAKMQPGIGKVAAERLEMPVFSTPEEKDWVAKKQPFVSAQVRDRKGLAVSLLGVLDANRDLFGRAATFTSAPDSGKKAIGRTLKDELEDIWGSAAASGVDISGSSFQRRRDFENDPQPVIIREKETVSEIGKEEKAKGPTPEEIAEEQRRAREKAIEDLQAQVTQLTEALEEADKRITTVSNQIDVMSAGIIAEDALLSAARQELTSKQKALELLPDAAENLKKLRELSDQSAATILELAEEWDSVRLPLLQKLKSLQKGTVARREECNRKLAQLKSMRSETVAMLDKLKAQDSKQLLLVQQWNSAPRGIQRQEFVRRIMDVVRNLDKQKSEVAKILKDVKSAQKQLSSASETAGRNASIVKELVVRAGGTSERSASRDSLLSDLYQDVVELIRTFDELVETVSDIGKTKASARETEGKLKALDQPALEAKLSQILKDLSAVRAENKSSK